jgi:hypothetical protein
VFSPEEPGRLAGNAAQSLPVRIDEVPFRLVFRGPEEPSRLVHSFRSSRNDDGVSGFDKAFQFSEIE